eukprot:6213045-Pleurochrysis_carterae.AAC.5
MHANASSGPLGSTRATRWPESPSFSSWRARDAENVCIVAKDMGRRVSPGPHGNINALLLLGTRSSRVANGKDAASHAES